MQYKIKNEDININKKETHAIYNNHCLDTLIKL